MSTVGIIGAIVGLALLLPNIAIAIRRLHDRDKSGWWLLLVLIPLIGAIILIVWFVVRGTAGSEPLRPRPAAGPDLAAPSGEHGGSACERAPAETVMQSLRTNDLLRFFFTVGGRISRREYLLGLAFIYAVNAALLAFALHQADRDLALGLAIIVSASPSTIGQFVLVAKRCHDHRPVGRLRAGAADPLRRLGVAGGAGRHRRQ